MNVGSLPTNSLSRWQTPSTLQVGLEDRFQDQQRGGLHHAVADRGNPQRPLLPVRFRQVDPPDRLRLIPFRSQFLRQFVQPPLHAVLLDVLERLAVHAGRSAVGTALRPGRFQHVAAIHLVVQGVETKVGRTLRFVMQRRAEFLQRIGVGRLFANHPRALLLRTLILELRPLGSAGITRFQRYYEPLRHRRDRAWPSRVARCGCRRCRRRFPVLHVHSFDTCRRLYPGGIAKCVCR